MRVLLLAFALASAACAAGTWPAPDGAPTFAEARAVCRAVAEGRAASLEVARGEEWREEEHWTSVDIDNDGTPEDVAILTDSTSTPSIEVRPGGNETLINRASSSIHNEAGVPFGGQLLLTRSNGRIYQVTYADNDTLDYPQYVAIYLPGGEGRWLCSFQSAAPRLRALHDSEAALCAVVEQRRTVGGDNVAPESLEDDYDYVGRDHGVRVEGAVDFMNNGQPRELLGVQLSVQLGDGPGCTTEFFALADGFEPYAQPESPEANALAELQIMNPYNIEDYNPYGGGCQGNVARFHNIDGSVVLEQRFPGERPERRAHEFWRVSRVENGEVVRLCEATAFDPRPRAIAYNAVLYPQTR